MHHFLYKITNIHNNKVYVGVRSSKVDPLVSFDGYLGSGFALKRAIAKYGKDSFIREVLVACDSKKYAYYLESLYVNDAFISRADTYNLVVGGKGGYIGEAVYNSDKFRKAASEGAKKQSEDFIAQYGAKAMRERMKYVHSCKSAEARKITGAKVKAHYDNPEFVAKKKASAKRSWQKPDSEERRAKVSEQSKAYWESMPDSERASISAARSKRNKGLLTAFDKVSLQFVRVTSKEYFANPNLLNLYSREYKQNYKEML